MMMMFVGGVVLLFDGLLVLFLLLEIYGVGVFAPTGTLIGVKLLIGINVGFLTTSSYVDPAGFPCGGKYFLFPQNKP